jgi:uncharacterized SAM-binding protein YcdF (DUF218 family)
MDIKKISDEQLAKILWDYNSLDENPEKADVIFVPCSTDIRVAIRSAELFKKGYAPYILFTGSEGKMSKDLFDKPEAVVFAGVAKKEGVPENVILLETEATNTGENIKFGRKILEECELDIKKILIVQKPYALRRMYATFKKQWPEVDFTLASTNVSYEEYPNEFVNKQLLIETLVKTTQRIKEYPSKGFQIEQEIPEDVWNAFEELVHRGYTKHIIT